MKQSIQNISDQIKIVKDSLNNFKETQKSQQTSLDDLIVEEISVNDILEDSNFILKQLNYLINAHKVFSRISTYSERQNINTYLGNLNSYLSQNEFNGISTQINLLKSLLRNFHTFFQKDYISDFFLELNKLQKQEKEIQTLLDNTKETENSISTQKESIDTVFNNLDEKRDEVETNIQNLEEKYENLTTKLDDAVEKEKEITDLLTESKSHEEIITNFSSRVEKREAQLDKQEIRTSEYEKKLDEFNEQQADILKEAQNLIEQAKTALKYKTVEGISASMQAQYDEANNKKVLIGWLVSAVFFIMITLGLGIWLVSDSNLKDSENAIALVMGRIALLPIALAGAIFSAKQYAKQKNIIEDYAYKMVIAKSIVGFSEQLLKVKETNEGYQTYIKKVFEELLQDPLRDRKNKCEENKNVMPNIVDFADKISPKD